MHALNDSFMKSHLETEKKKKNLQEEPVTQEELILCSFIKKKKPSQQLLVKSAGPKMLTDKFISKCMHVHTMIVLFIYFFLGTEHQKVTA